jgi:dextranase
LLTPTGRTYALGDFLRVVDPAAAEWSTHLTEDLATAVATVGLDGFHLDQYGWPKRAARADGTYVDMSESFAALIDAVRVALPGSRLVFNNVNDFPTWRTARSPLDAVYIEVWEPHTTLGSLATVVSRARLLGGGKPVVAAAYQHVFDSADPAAAELAASFTMATLFSHGATHLLVGEGDRLLVDPYYVRNHPMTPSTAALLRRWYDFLVEHREILMSPVAVDVTGSYAGSYNDDCDVSYPAAEVQGSPEAGTVWRRVVERDGALVVHLVNLCGQRDTLWDAPREAVTGPGGGRLRVRRMHSGVPRVRVADPDRTPYLVEVPVTVEGEHAVADLPEPHIWQLVVIDAEAP